MSGHKTPAKHLYGAAKIEAQAVEKTRRRDEHEEDAINHDRRTKAARAQYAWFKERKERLEGICRDSERDILKKQTEQQVLRQKIQETMESLNDHKEQHGGAARVGERAAEVSAKYTAYLEMESDELDL